MLFVSVTVTKNRLPEKNDTINVILIMMMAMLILPFNVT